MVFVGNVMVIGKEDKASVDGMSRAVAELQAKHRPTSAVVFGKLQYIILMAAAGPSLQVFARRLGSEDRLVFLLRLQVAFDC
jgi:hypothetical protein